MYSIILYYVYNKSEKSSLSHNNRSFYINDFLIKFNHELQFASLAENVASFNNKQCVLIFWKTLVNITVGSLRLHQIYY